MFINGWLGSMSYSPSIQSNNMQLWEEWETSVYTACQDMLLKKGTEQYMYHGILCVKPEE